MIRLVVDPRVLLAVTMPPALPNFGCVLAPRDLRGFAFSINLGASRAGGLCLVSDCPDETRQFARDRGGHHRRRLPRAGKLAIAAAQPFLGFPRRVADWTGQALLSQQLLSADPSRKPIAPGGLDQHPPRRTILARHGVTPDIVTAHSTGRRVADVILEEADARSADVVVMGGYGHTRVRERVFSGTTADILAAAELPILVAH